MKKIETEISFQSFNLRQIERDGMVAMYEKTNGGSIIGYEVIIIKVKKESIAFGKKYPEREAYPSSEEFGRYGWDVPNKEDAYKRYANLCQNSVAILSQ